MRVSSRIAALVVMSLSVVLLLPGAAHAALSVNYRSLDGSPLTPATTHSFEVHFANDGVPTEAAQSMLQFMPVNPLWNGSASGKVVPRDIQVSGTAAGSLSCVSQASSSGALTCSIAGGFVGDATVRYTIDLPEVGFVSPLSPPSMFGPSFSAPLGWAVTGDPVYVRSGGPSRLEITPLADFPTRVVTPDGAVFARVLVRNIGTGPAQGVRLLAPAPAAGAAIHFARGCHLPLEHRAGHEECVLGSLAPRAQAVVTLALTPPRVRPANRLFEFVVSAAKFDAAADPCLTWRDGKLTSACDHAGGLRMRLNVVTSTRPSAYPAAATSWPDLLDGQQLWQAHCSRACTADLELRVAPAVAALLKIPSGVVARGVARRSTAGLAVSHAYVPSAVRARLKRLSKAPLAGTLVLRVREGDRSYSYTKKVIYRP